jgi:hypothetical protein
MNIVNHIKQNFSNVSQLNRQYVSTPPHPTLCIDNFIPLETVRAMKQECNNCSWEKEFTRADSRMIEKSDIDDCPVATEVKNQLSSKSFLRWMGDITGHHDLIPDPYMVGAGYMRCGRGDSLKIHTDFNFNNDIKLYRMISLIIYLNEEWQDEWNGDLQFWDFEKKGCINRYYPRAGRMVLWRYHRLGFHGHPEPLTCPNNIYRDGFRMFYYVSEQAGYKLEKTPHRSLYYYDPNTQEPYDISSEK